jgi:hypothetical protein
MKTLLLIIFVGIIILLFCWVGAIITQVVWNLLADWFHFRHITLFMAFIINVALSIVGGAFKANK